MLLNQKAQKAIFFFEKLCPALFLILITGCVSEYKIIDTGSQYFAELQQEQVYVLGCGDRLTVSVWGEDKLKTETIIRPDGIISLSLIGDMQVKGLSVEELKKELNRRYSEYINEPNVSVAVADIKSLVVYILGEVSRPGTFAYTAPTDVLQCIALAGGFTIYAKKDKLQIIRTIGNEKVKIKFNYNQVVEGKNISQNIPLRPGDIIIVP